jgi:methyl-accepting chemotaxis protein
MDTSHTLVYINRMAASVAGMEPEDCVGKKFWEVLYDSPACHEEKCAAGQAVRTGKVSVGEAHFQVRGRDWPVRVICSPRFDDDGRTVIGCFQVMYEAHEEIRVSREIMRLVSAGRSGDLSTRGNLDEFKGNFRTLVEGLNALLEAFVQPLRTFGESATALALASDTLSGVSRLLVSNAEETAAQAQAARGASDQVSRNVSAVTSGAEQMQISIREISKNSNEAARVARSAVSFAKETNVKVSKLGESSREIGNVVKVVTSIAQQTNLLALNATIEAARAGEAGKGFAVVANEVKELAKKTAHATEEIGQKIEAIQADTKAAVKAIEEIGSFITQIDDFTNVIAAAIEEQTATTNEIGVSIAKAAQGAEDIASNISTVAAAAHSTTQAAGQGIEASQDIGRIAGQLRKMLSEYKY